MRMSSFFMICFVVVGSYAFRRLQSSDSPSSLKDLYKKYANADYYNRNPKAKKLYDGARNAKRAYMSGLDAALTAFRKNRENGGNTAGPSAGANPPPPPPPAPTPAPPAPAPPAPSGGAMIGSMVTPFSALGPIGAPGGIAIVGAVMPVIAPIPGRRLESTVLQNIK